jgi:hypothetical protein
MLEFIALVDSLGGPEASFDTFNYLNKGADSLTRSRAQQTVTKTEFQQAAKKLGFEGNAIDVFFDLDANRSGNIGRKEFEDCVNDYHYSSFDGDRLLVETLVDFSYDKTSAWPTPSLPEFFRKEELGEARLPGAAEERESLFQEDLRRQDDIARNGAQSTSRKLAAAAQEGLKALGFQHVEEYSHLQDVLSKSAAGRYQGDIIDFQLNGEDFAVDTELNPSKIAIASRGALVPTTSIDAQVVVADSTEQRMWLQTSVVDRTGTGSTDIRDVAFVLELRDQGSINSILHAQIDVSMIQSIDQSGPAIDMSDALGNAYFVITLHPDADLLNAKGVAGAVPWKVFHTGPGCVLQLYIIAGCSLWKRQEASNFFCRTPHYGALSGRSKPAPWAR